MTLSVSTFTEIHTALSLVALASGAIVVIGILRSRRPRLWTALYLITALATSATGFGFPSAGFGPSHWVGVMLLAALALVVLARYAFHLGGAWRWVYALGAVLGVYCLVFVAIAQAFLKVPALKPLAPTLSEPPFAIAESVALVVFATIAAIAAKRFYPQPVFVRLR
jgi:hypothetical protein